MSYMDLMGYEGWKKRPHSRGIGWVNAYSLYVEHLWIGMLMLGCFFFGF